MSVSTEIGYVSSINRYIVWINGLPNVKTNEIIVGDSGALALVTGIDEDSVEAIMLDNRKVIPNESFKRTYKQLSVNIGNFLIGRAISALGQPIDGKGRLLGTGEQKFVEDTPTHIKSREKITEQFETGTTLVDMLVPLAVGQRELIVGDGHSGKTGFLIDTIINQKNKGLICIYALIGKPVNEIKSILEILRINQAMQYTIIVGSASSDIPSLIYLNPIVATTIAEYYQKKGKKVLLILDDLGIHAKFYREISLLAGRSPGRDSYPGDIFYQQAKLIEKAGRLNVASGGGSITALPVIETNLDDFSSYMTTNLIGMTDGHLMFKASRYHQGYRPSVDVSLSVSRVGRQTQNLAQKSLADKIKALIVEADKLQSYAMLGSEVSAQTQTVLKQGHQIETLLNQPQLAKIPIIIQMILLGLLFTPLFQNQEANFILINRQKIIDYLINYRGLEQFRQRVEKMKDYKEFVQSLGEFIPELTKICQKG